MKLDGRKQDPFALHRNFTLLISRLMPAIFLSQSILLRYWTRFFPYKLYPKLWYGEGRAVGENESGRGAVFQREQKRFQMKKPGQMVDCPGFLQHVR